LLSIAPAAFAMAILIAVTATLAVFYIVQWRTPRDGTGRPAT
jgi:hypothetical protein